MNKQSRLELLENLSLLGSGVGAMASIALNQASFAIAPLSLSLILGVLNRRHDRQKLQENQAAVTSLDQQLSQQLNRVQHQVSNLPTAETIHQLSKGVVLRNRELAEHLYAEISSVQEEFQQRFERLEREDLNAICHDLHQLSETCNALSASVAQFQVGGQQTSDLARIEQVETVINHFNLEIGDLQARLEALANQAKPSLATLQERVNRLDRLLSKLPPPVDVTSLKREVTELIRIIGELVPKRDVLALTQEVRGLQQQQETLQQSLRTIDPLAVQQLQDRVESLTQQQRQLEAHITHISRSHIPAAGTPTAGTPHPEPAAILPKNLDMVALQSRLNHLAKQIALAANQPAVTAQHLQSLEQRLQHLTDRVQSLSQFKTDLIFDFDLPPDFTASPELAGSRTVLLEALKATQHRLILIYPWSAQCPLDETVMQALETFLSQNRQLSIGWCHIASREDDRLLRKMKRGWRTESHSNDLQNTLRKLLHLKRTYPDRFEFKVLGTHENFLICDQTFAVLGMADTFQTTTPFSELPLKLRTHHPEVIQHLIHRFDQPSLAPDDLTAYWNRAVTRHDLGDYSGAIADYTHILTHHPPDAITYNYRGLAYYDAGNVDAALNDFNQSIQLHPYQTAAYCNWGFIRAEQGDYLGAVKDYSCAIQNQPNCSIAYFHRGLARQKLEHYQEAITDYTEAIHLMPDAAAAYYYRSQVWQMLECYETAIDDLVQAAELFTVQGSTANAQRVQKNLTQLRQFMASHLPRQGKGNPESQKTKSTGLSGVT
jgi:tetratricopeptide (TPR) repeat protein